MSFNNRTAQTSRFRLELAEWLSKQTQPITKKRMAEHFGVGPEVVRLAVQRLMELGEIVSTIPNSPKTAYVISSNFTGFASKSDKTPANTVNKMGGVYDGKELRPFDGRPNCNQHMHHPSLMGSRRVYPIKP